MTQRHLRSVFWSRGGLTWTDIGKRLLVRSQAHKWLDRAALLSFYLLLAFFPLLIVLSSLTGILRASQTETYWRLLNYITRFIPRSAFSVFHSFLARVKLSASRGELSFGLIASLRTASSGISALMEPLNVTFEVPISHLLVAPPIGLDFTDEDAFQALNGIGLSVLVRESYRDTSADV